MPFLFHSEKKSIFQQAPSSPPNEAQKRQIQHILEKASKKPYEYQVSMRLDKHHPFRGIDKFEPPEFSKTVFFRHLNPKKDTLRKLYEVKWSQREQEIHKAQIENQMPLNLRLQVTRSQTLLKDYSQERGIGGMREANSAGKIISLNRFQKKIIRKDILSPGPTTYDPSLEVCNKIKAFDWGNQVRWKQYKAGDQKSKTFKDQSQKVDFKLSEGFKYQVSRNFRQKNTQKSFNDQLKHLLLRKKADLPSIMPKLKTNIEEDEYQKDDFQPGPGSYHVASQISNKSIPVKKGDTMGKSPKYRILMAQSPGPGAYSSQINCMTSEGNAPFNTSVRRELKFDKQGLCVNEFYYHPKNQMVDAVLKKNISWKQGTFGSRCRRFEQFSLKKDEISQQIGQNLTDTTTNLGRAAVSLQSRQKREIFGEIKKASKVGPSDYQNDPYSIGKIKNKISDITRVPPLIKREKIEKENREDMLDLGMGEDKAGRLHNCDLVFGKIKTGSPKNKFRIEKQSKQQFDGFYDKEKAFPWQKKSYNVNYKNQ